MRNPALFTLWGGEFASRIGISVFQIALLWYLLEATADDSLKTGLITMIGFLPAVVVGLWAGVLVDRLEYRAVMLGANLARAALAAALPLLILLAGLPLAGIALMGFLLSSATAFFNPARDAVIPLLAKKHELFSANSLVQSAWQFSLPVGPLLAAAALTFAPVETLFYGVALSFALSFAVLLYLKKARREGEGGQPSAVSAPRREARGGLPAGVRAGWGVQRGAGRGEAGAEGRDFGQVRRAAEKSGRIIHGEGAGEGQQGRRQTRRRRQGEGRAAACRADRR